MHFRGGHAQVAVARLVGSIPNAIGDHSAASPYLALDPPSGANATGSLPGAGGIFLSTPEGRILARPRICPFPQKARRDNALTVERAAGGSSPPLAGHCAGRPRRVGSSCISGNRLAAWISMCILFQSKGRRRSGGPWSLGLHPSRMFALERT